MRITSEGHNHQPERCVAGHPAERLRPCWRARPSIGCGGSQRLQVSRVDRSELKQKRDAVCAMSAEARDWPYDLREAVAKDKPDPEPPHCGKGGKKELMIQRRKVLKKAIFGILKATFLRLACLGGIKHFSGNIYEESRGVLKIFIEQIVRDVITFCDYKKRKTVTPIDVTFALKQHRCAVYGFTQPI